MHVGARIQFKPTIVLNELAVERERLAVLTILFADDSADGSEVVLADCRVPLQILAAFQEQVHEKKIA